MNLLIDLLMLRRTIYLMTRVRQTKRILVPAANLSTNRIMTNIWRLTITANQHLVPINTNQLALYHCSPFSAFKPIAYAKKISWIYINLIFIIIFNNFTSIEFCAIENIERLDILQWIAVLFWNKTTNTGFWSNSNYTSFLIETQLS